MTESLRGTPGDVALLNRSDDVSVNSDLFINVVRDFGVDSSTQEGVREFPRIVNIPDKFSPYQYIDLSTTANSIFIRLSTPQNIPTPESKPSRIKSLSFHLIKDEEDETWSFEWEQENKSGLIKALGPREKKLKLFMLYSMDNG